MTRDGRFTGGLVVVSGPSGSGKTTIVDRLGADPRVTVAVTATTRAPRPGEQHGVDYFFLTPEQFRDRIARGDFVEYKEVFGNGHLYGSLKQPLDEAIARGDRCYVLEIDVEGGLDLKRQGYRGKYIFIAPPSLGVLKERITKRNTESPEAARKRLDKARIEMEQQDQYDVVVVNDDLEEACRRVRQELGLGEPTRAKSN
jgi:guanylate kinase